MSGLSNEQPYAIAITGHKIDHYPNGDEYVFFIVQYLMRFLKIDHQLGNMKETTTTLDNYLQLKQMSSPSEELRRSVCQE